MVFTALFFYEVHKKFTQSISRDLYQSFEPSSPESTLQRFFSFFQSILFVYSFYLTLSTYAKIPDVITKESKDTQFFIKTAIWNDNQIWPNTTLNLGKSSNNSMFLNFTTKSYILSTHKWHFFHFFQII